MFMLSLLIWSYLAIVMALGITFVNLAGLMRTNADGSADHGFRGILGLAVFLLFCGFFAGSLFNLFDLMAHVDHARLSWHDFLSGFSFKSGGILGTLSFISGLIFSLLTEVVRLLWKTLSTFKWFYGLGGFLVFSGGIVGSCIGIYASLFPRMDGLDSLLVRHVFTPPAVSDVLRTLEDVFTKGVEFGLVGCVVGLTLLLLVELWSALFKRLTERFFLTDGQAFLVGYWLLWAVFSATFWRWLSRGDFLLFVAAWGLYLLARTTLQLPAPYGVLGLTGAALGSFIGYLLRPSVPLVGQLPFTTVVTRGWLLEGLNLALLPIARASFNFVVAGLILGMIAGVSLAKLLANSRDYSHLTPQDV